MLVGRDWDCPTTNEQCKSYKASNKVDYIGNIPSNNSCKASLSGAKPSELKADQLRMYENVTWHVQHTLAGNERPLLHMLIRGEGRTGKSKIIQTITDKFTQSGVKHLLLKVAYTGMAASLIDGKTTHTIGMIVMESGGKMSNKMKKKLQAFWKHITYLIIEKVSMISKSFLMLLSRQISTAKESLGREPSSSLFCGISVAISTSSCLSPYYQLMHYTIQPILLLACVCNSIGSQVGHSIYEGLRLLLSYTSR